jgi:hypothetical protein
MEQMKRALWEVTSTNTIRCRATRCAALRLPPTHRSLTILAPPGKVPVLPDRRFEDVARARIGQIIDGIVDWASKRLIYSVDSRRFLINVFVRSKPKDDAVFTLSYVDNKLLRSVRTNETMKEVYRGLYLFKVERDGFKTAQGPLNLVDWDWNQLGVVCVMVSQNSPSEPFPCNPQ